MFGRKNVSTESVRQLALVLHDIRERQLWTKHPSPERSEMVRLQIRRLQAAEKKAMQFLSSLEEKHVHHIGIEDDAGEDIRQIFAILNALEKSELNSHARLLLIQTIGKLSGLLRRVLV